MTRFSGACQWRPPSVSRVRRSAARTEYTRLSTMGNAARGAGRWRLVESRDRLHVLFRESRLQPPVQPEEASDDMPVRTQWDQRQSQATTHLKAIGLIRPQDGVDVQLWQVESSDGGRPGGIYDL